MADSHRAELETGFEPFLTGMGGNGGPSGRMARVLTRAELETAFEPFQEALRNALPPRGNLVLCEIESLTSLTN